MFSILNMRLANWLEDAFGTNGRVRVLRFLDQSSSPENTLREIARSIGVGPSTAQVAINSLLDAGIVDGRRVGRSHALRIRDGFARQALRRIFEEERSLEALVAKTATAAATKGTSVILFGSGARGQQRRTSDLDILVVANEKDDAEKQAASVAAALGQVAVMRVRAIPLSASSLRRKRNVTWIQDVRRDGKVLAGPGLDAWF